jgi:rRNA pseudouridine-1189 N-methylase Emg1 (Nep1/Mra1 family)
LIVIYIIIGIVFCSGTGIQHPFVYLKASAHSFTPNDYASFIASVDQFQTELNLVQPNVEDNNFLLVQEHIEKAGKLFYRNLISELEEQDQKNADNITVALETLQRLSLNASMKEHQKINQIASYIHTKSDEIINWSLEQRVQQQQQQEGGVETRFYNMVMGFITNLFGGGDEKNEDDTEIQPLRLAELVDFVLIDYGDAFNVDYDMTDMSNMVEMSGNQSSAITHNMSVSDNVPMHMENTSATAVDIRNQTGKNHTIIDLGAYQSAQELSSKALEVFNSELKPLSTDEGSKIFIHNLENGIIKFNNLIRDEASPMDLMMIVHAEIHPNLLEAFDIELQ